MNITKQQTLTGANNMTITTASAFLADFKARHAAPKAKRKSAKQQVEEAKADIINEILADMRNKKRSIPKEWERGFISAMSVVEGKK